MTMSTRPLPPIEALLCSLDARIGALAALLMVQPVVVDTDALLRDIAHHLETGRPTRLQVAAKLGVVRLLASWRLFAEVPRKLRDAAPKFGFDPEAASACYWADYEPFIRFVDADAFPVPLQAAPLYERYPSDLGTARLVGLVSPVLFLTGDRDFRDCDLGVALWVESLEAAEVAAIVDLMFWGLVATLHRVLPALREAAATRLGRRSAVDDRVLFVALGLVVASTVVFPKGAGRVANFVTALALSIAKSAGGLAMGTLGAQLSAMATLHQAASGDPRSVGDIQMLARLLAVAPAGVPIDALASILSMNQEGVIPWLLDDATAFVEVTEGRWQLGKAMDRLVPTPP